MQRFREWLIGTYNGVYKIILEPSMPTRQTVFLLVVAFIIGLIWAYALAPVSYYDGDPSQLDQILAERVGASVVGSLCGGLQHICDRPGIRIQYGPTAGGGR